MMIAIKGMKMPTECEYCGFCRYYPENGNVWCNANNRILKLYWKEPDWTHLDVKRPDWCPLIEINTDGNTISRQQTIDALMQEFKRIPTNSIRAKIVVENLPSAQPERKTGRWIDDNCSECGQYVFHGDVRNFCPHCGAKMENDL